jgi:hypothetical protein
MTKPVTRSDRQQISQMLGIASMDARSIYFPEPEHIAPLAIARAR